MVEKEIEVDIYCNDDSDSYSECDSNDDDDDEVVLRAKWMFDGAKTIDDCIEKCNGFVEWLNKMKHDGWELKDAVNDDWGFLERSMEIG